MATATKPPHRPTKYTPATVATILDALRAGLPRATAARLAGVHRDTFFTWLHQHPDFSDAVETAQAAAVAEAVASIRRQGQESWQALAWLLERTHREEFGRPTSDVHVHGQIQHAHLVAGLSSVDAWGKAVAELAPALIPESVPDVGVDIDDSDTLDG